MNIQHNFDDRARTDIYVSYLYGQKGYRIKSHQIHTYRDIIFHESTFPYHDIPPISPLLENQGNINPITDNGTFDYLTNHSVTPLSHSIDTSVHSNTDTTVGSSTTPTIGTHTNSSINPQIC